MPSIRKRIGYLPSLNTKEIITKIAREENLSQSKVVGLLVEEALIARGILELHNKNNSSLKYSDIDELISDKGITYNTKRYNRKSDNISSESKEAYNEDLFEQFKQFILFKKMIEEK
tara:strand:+ start:495 stop:845 length:351 start_codon:yes stop_codon:yes gene_type:complete